MLILILCCMFPRGAQAATAKKLFSLKISDGAVTKTVPVYQYKASDGTITVDAKKSMRSITVSALAKNLSVSVADKKSVYVKNYRSVTYMRTPSLVTGTKVLKYFVKTKEGKVHTFEIKANRPALPSVSSLKADVSSSGFKVGSGSLKITLKTKAQVACKTTIRIKNSAGKTVYTKVLGKKPSGTFTLNWSGKPSSGNKAGLSVSSYVPAGTYKIVAYVKYVYGKVSKVATKSIKVAVKDASGNDASSNFKAASWNWKVVLTGNEKVDYLCELICQKTIKNGMSDVQKAKALYTWLGKHVMWTKQRNVADKIDVSSEAGLAAVKAYKTQSDNLVAAGKATVDCNIYGKAQFALTALSKGRGDCWNMSDAYVALLRHAGIFAGTVGHTAVGGSAMGHYWTIVKISGKYYYADVNQYSNSYYQQGITNNYYYFLCGSNSCYNLALYNTVNTSKYPLAKQVSKTDCPGRNS